MDVVHAATPGRELRALVRIARDCAALERLVQPHVPACARLEAELGAPLAAFLVGALRGRPPRDAAWLAA